MREEKRIANEKKLKRYRSQPDPDEEDLTTAEETTAYPLEDENTPTISPETLEDNEDNDEAEESNNKVKKIIFWSIILFITFFIYTSNIATRIIEVKEYKITVNNIPTSFDGLKVVHFSDLHYGTTINENELKKIVNKINELKPDLVFFTGDLIDKNIKLNDENIKFLKEELSKINPQLYKYAIYGDEDNETFKDIMESSQFIILNNETKLLYYQDNTPILIAGFNNNDNPNYTILTDLINETDPSSLFKIVLTHQPDTTDNFITYNPNLILAGHTLGGLVKLPFIKPLFLQEGAQKYYNSFTEINNTKLFISNGLGTSSIAIRLNNHPSINFYRFYKA